MGSPGLLKSPSTRSLSSSLRKVPAPLPATRRADSPKAALGAETVNPRGRLAQRSAHFQSSPSSPRRSLRAGPARTLSPPREHEAQERLMQQNHQLLRMVVEQQHQTLAQQQASIGELHDKCNQILSVLTADSR